MFVTSSLAAAKPELLLRTERATGLSGVYHGCVVESQEPAQAGLPIHSPAEVAVALIPAPLITRRRAALFTALFIALVSLYLTTYGGRIESGDTFALFDASESLVYYGDTVLDKSAWFSQPDPTFPESVRPSPIDVEPLQMILAAPLIWVADKLPGVGLVHAAWLFNVLVCAAVGGVLFLYALALGYSERSGVIFGLLVGAATGLWPYSKTFFREPLAALLIVLTALVLHRWRMSRYRSWALAAGSLLLLAASFLTKEAVIFALPALILVALPAVRGLAAVRLLRGAVWALAAALLMFTLVSLVGASSNLSPLYAALAPLLRRSPDTVRLIQTALHTYLLSPGGSLWGTSPLLLLCLPGWWLLYRRGQYRLILLTAVALGSFALGYAFFRGAFWFGGLSWPPRFLIPALPMFRLGLLPALDGMLVSRRRVWLLLLLLLTLFSLWIQFSGVALNWEDYHAALPPESGGVAEWGGGLNVVQYMRWVVIPQLWTRLPLDFAWVRIGLYAWPVLALLMVVAAWSVLYRMLTGGKARFWLAGLVGAGGVLLLAALFSLSPDPLYDGSNPNMRSALEVIQSQTQPGDILLLANNNEEPFFTNFAKFRFPRVVSLPDPPGEQSNPDDPPLVRSPNPDALLVKETIPLLHNLAADHDRLWLYAETGPWIPFSVRPVERFMATHYYPIREVSVSPPDARIRFIEYSTVPAPDPFAFRGADHLTDLRFGESVRLSGFSLPAGLTYSAGGILPLSLLWQTDASLSQSLTVAWFVVDAGGVVVAQGMDMPPAWGFAPTSAWIPGVPVWDNRALWLPANLPAGDYQLWVRMYPADAPDALLPVNGATGVEGTIGVLPVIITITP